MGLRIGLLPRVSASRLQLLQPTGLMPLNAAVIKKTKTGTNLPSAELRAAQQR